MKSWGIQTSLLWLYEIARLQLLDLNPHSRFHNPMKSQSPRSIREALECHWTMAAVVALYPLCCMILCHTTFLVMASAILPGIVYKELTLRAEGRRKCGDDTIWPFCFIHNILFCAFNCIRKVIATIITIHFSDCSK